MTQLAHWLFLHYFTVPNSRDRKWWWGVIVSEILSEILTKFKYEPVHDKSNKMTCAPSEDSDQHGHPPSLIRVFAVCIIKAWVLSYQLSAQQRLWSDWADAQADPSLRWVHMPYCWFCHALAQIVYSNLIMLLMSLRSTYQNRIAETHKVDIHKNKIRNVQTSTQSDQNFRCLHEECLGP